MHANKKSEKERRQGAPPPQPPGALIYLHVGVGEAAGRQVVGVHGDRLLLGSHVLVLVECQGIHRALVV